MIKVILTYYSNQQGDEIHQHYFDGNARYRHFKRGCQVVEILQALVAEKKGFEIKCQNLLCLLEDLLDKLLELHFKRWVHLISDCLGYKQATDLFMLKHLEFDIRAPNLVEHLKSSQVKHFKTDQVDHFKSGSVEHLKPGLQERLKPEQKERFKPDWQEHSRADLAENFSSG